MPQYPRNQADVVSQVNCMIAGYREHPDLFPGSDPDQLSELRAAYLAASAKLTEAQSLTASAAKEKLSCFTSLQQAMKDQIKRSQADTSSCPVYLSFIGWGPRRMGEPIASPGSPTSLTIQPTDGDSLILRWDKPDRDSGGPLGCYLVQVRIAADSSNDNRWRLVATTFETEYELTTGESVNLPGKCEFRILAANKAGKSYPSNTVVSMIHEIVTND